MANILTLAFATEGSTDERFLNAIIKKLFEDLAFSCIGVIEVYDPVFIPGPKKETFVDSAIEYAKCANQIGMNILCIHTDADSNSDVEALKYKINPAFQSVIAQDDTHCKNLVAIIPIHMTEAWMLADKDLLKLEMDTNKSNRDLGIDRQPEMVADPKEVIKNALSIAQDHLPNRRNRIEIADLYQPIGQKIDLDKLRNLSSFKKFESSAVEALKSLNYLH